MTPADQSYLLTIAALLRAGLLADGIPPYVGTGWTRAR